MHTMSACWIWSTRAVSHHIYYFMLFFSFFGVIFTC